jgi:hypothetical protein
MSATKNINAEKIKGNLNVNSISGTTISGGTFYGDGSNLSGISSDNFYVTGGTFNDVNSLIYFDRNDTLSAFTVDLSNITSVDTFVTGLTYDSNTYDLTLLQNEGQSDLVVNLSTLTGKTDLTLFNSHTGDTNNPHQTSFSSLTFTAHTHTLSEVTDFTSYSGSVQSQLDVKVEESLFSNHTGDTNNPHQTSFSNLTSTAHTHTLSEVADFTSYSGSVQSQLDVKVEESLFSNHTGDTNNPHQTSFSSLTSTAHTHTLSEVTDFISYSGSVQSQLDTKIENGINVGGQVEVFSGKSGSDLYFKTLSGGSNTVLTEESGVITIETTLPEDQNSYVTGFTYDGVNSLEISLNNGSAYTQTIESFSASTISGGTFYGDGSNLTGTVPDLNEGQIFVGNSGNTATSVEMTGDVNIDVSGITTIQSDSVTYDKIQDVTQKALLGSESISGGTVSEIPIIDQFLNTGSVSSLLSNKSNWDINGFYIGSTITNTFQGQMYSDGNYFFIAIDDNVWIRLARV